MLRWDKLHKEQTNFKENIFHDIKSLFRTSSYSGLVLVRISSYSGLVQSSLNCTAVNGHYNAVGFIVNVRFEPISLNGQIEIYVISHRSNIVLKKLMPGSLNRRRIRRTVDRFIPNRWATGLWKNPESNSMTALIARCFSLIICVAHSSSTLGQMKTPTLQFPHAHSSDYGIFWNSMCTNREETILRRS